MKRNLFLLVLIFFSIVIIGCGGKQIKTTPDKPVSQVEEYRERLLDNYGRWFTPSERKEFKVLSSVEEVELFEDKFWWGDGLCAPSRDPNPNTPEHELKDQIDQRIRDIKNEIFASDPDIPGTYFASSGGLKGDLAHVYLFYGTPHYKTKVSEGNYHVQLMAWYYFDFRGRTLFRFLFYEKYGKLSLFKKHMYISDRDYFSNP